MARRTIQVHDDTWEELWHIKGPRRSFEDAIRDLIAKVYPREEEPPDQAKLKRCPSCGEFSITEDPTGSLFCQDCGYEADEQEV